MPRPPLPLDEEERLAALARYAVLDTLPEPEFDRLTSLAARVFDAPMALLSLVSRNRQWFKSEIGFGACQTSRDQAFCAYTILSPEPLIVPDATLDPRFTDNPLVTGPPHIRFYAGAPLISPEGQRLGTLCVLDTAPRQFSEPQARMLSDLATLAMDALELRLSRHRAQNGYVLSEDADSSYANARPAAERPEQREANLLRANAALREAEARYRGIFENAVEGIFQSTPEGALLSGNPALARLLGYDSTQAMIEALGNLKNLYAQPPQRAELERLMHEEGAAVNFESEIYRCDGSRIWISENVRAVRDASGQVTRYEGTVQDITERKSAEEVLASERAQLEERVRARTAELAQANEALREEVAVREHAEAAVRRSEGKFRALIENTQDLITIVDTEVVALYITPSIQHMLGYGPNELLGVNLFPYVHPDDQPAVHQSLERILHQGAAFVRNEYRFRHKDGSWRLLESVASLMPADSPIAGLVINSRDITEREAHARQQEGAAELGRLAMRGATLEAMFDAAAALVTRALGVKLSTITELLPNGEELLVRAGDGWPPGVVGQMVVRSWRRIKGEIDLLDSEPLIIPDLRQDALRYPALTPELLHEQPVSTVSVLIQSGGKTFGTLAALSTELREFSRQDIHFLQAVAHLLSSFIERRKGEEALRAAKEEAERANAVKGEFLSRVSHELRTPLNSILGFGQLLELEEDLGPRNRQSVEHILVAGRRLLELVDEVLDIARSQAAAANPAGDAAEIEAALDQAIQIFPLPPEETPAP